MWHSGSSAILGIVLATLGLVTIVVSTFIPEPPPQPSAAELGYRLVTEDSETYLCVENIGEGTARNLKVWALLSPRYWESADDEGPDYFGRVIGPMSMEPGSSVREAISITSYELLLGRTRLEIAMTWTDDVSEHAPRQAQARDTLLIMR